MEQKDDSFDQENSARSTGLGLWIREFIGKRDLIILLWFGLHLVNIELAYVMCVI